jgi:uncharacterized protein YfaA (DUF2138 family)
LPLTREQILASRRDRKPHRFEVPEWGGDVFIRVLSAKDQMLLADGTDPKDTPVKVLLYSLVDEDGARLFTDEDFGALLEEDFPVIMRVFSEAAHLNGLSTKELDEAMEGFASAPDEHKSTD